VKRLLILALWLPVAVWAANTNSFHNLSTSNLVSTGAITLNGGALTVSNNTLKLNGAAVTSGTYDHSALSNVLWTASGHTGTVGRIAGFLEGGAAGFVGIGSGLELDGSDNLNVTNSPMAAFAVSSGVASNSLKWNTVALQGNTGIGTENYLLRSLGVATPQAEFVDPSTVSVGTATYSAGSGYASSSGYATNAGAVGGVAVGGLVQTNDTRYLATLTNGLSSFLVGGTNLLVQSSAVDYRNKLTMNFGGLEAQYGGLWVGTNTITAQNYFLLWSAADSYVGNAPAVYFNSPGTTGILRFRQNNQDKIVLSNAQVYIPATLNTALINGNGSGISNVNAATLGGVALGGLVQTQELNSASNTLAAATALKANSNSVVTVVQTNSSGVAVTNQFTVGVANPTITLPTISAGGAITTNDILSVTVVRNSTQTYSNAFVRANHNVISSGASNLYSVADGSFSMPYDGAVQVGVQETAAFISGQQHITAIYTNNTLLARLSFWYPNNSLTQITAPYWSRPHYLTSGTTVQVYLFNQTAVTITGQADSVTTPAWISFTAIRGNQYQ